MFGELIGVWAASAWELMGRPRAFRLVEMGPGDGTLMSDILRAARHAPGFLDAADTWLEETSGPLQALQQDRLSDAAARWATSLDDVPNEAPAAGDRQRAARLPAGPPVCPHRHRLGRAGRGPRQARRLGFGLSPTPVAGLMPDAQPGQVYEQSAAQAALGAQLGARVARDGGAALLIDYGRAEPGFGDTLQALSRHEKVDPLAAPGEADLTVHADFPAVMAAARAEGAAAAILTQADFLARMGIGARAEALVRARPDRTAVLGRQLNRLISADEMGQLFKACAIHAPDWTPPAFEDLAEEPA